MATPTYTASGELQSVTVVKMVGSSAARSTEQLPALFHSFFRGKNTDNTQTDFDNHVKEPTHETRECNDNVLSD